MDTPLYPITYLDPRQTYLGIVVDGASADKMGGAVINHQATSGKHKQHRCSVISMFTV